MDFRRTKILAAIIKDYSERAEPIGSKELVKKYHLNVSSATVRNDMVYLEKEGYLKKPHYSAGRVPTDKGYRFFIREIMKRIQLSIKDRNNLGQEFKKLKDQHEEMGRSLARLISKTTDQAAIAFMPSTCSASGISKIINDPQLSTPKDIEKIAEFFDNLDEHAKKILKGKLEDLPEVFVGNESPLPINQNIGMIISRVRLPSGQRGVIGVIGPKRMKYDRNLSIVEYISKLLSGGLSGFFIVLLIH